MIISAKMIAKPRKIRACAMCGGLIYRSSLRLYGSGHVGDPPYVMYIHKNCTTNDDPKIDRAKATTQQSLSLNQKKG